MCGQLGYSSNKPFDIDKIRLLMLWNSLERGQDSTGLYSPINGLKKSILKGSSFLTASSNLYDFKPDNIFMAHLRQKTVGTVKMDNAHPFQRGNWVLQHNGTLDNYYDLRNKYNLSYNDYDVDSDIICGSLSVNNDIVKTLSEIDGPAAIIIQNILEPGILYVYRNKERPLYKGYVDNSMYISSIEDSLKFIGCKTVKEFKEDKLYAIKDGLIVKNYPKEIKSSPYKYYHNNYDSNSDDYNKYLNTIFRVNTNLTVNFMKNIFIKEGSLLKVKGINGYYMDVEKIFGDQISDSIYIKSHEFTLNNYLITNDSICRSLYDIYEGDEKNVIIKCGDLVRAKLITTEEGLDIKNIEVYDIKTNKKISEASKLFFIKLTDIELQSYYKSLNVKPDEKNQEEEIIDDNPVDDLFDNLEQHFIKMDDKIEKLKKLADVYYDKELMDAINDLDDINFEMQNKIIYDEQD